MPLAKPGTTLLGLLAVSGVIAAGSGCRKTSPTTATPNEPSTVPAAKIRFTEQSARAGISFQHTHGGSGKRYLPESVGSGCAWTDYDGDGWPDLVLVNCAPFGNTGSTSGPTAALYHNRQDGTFENRTAGSGLDVTMYGQGVSAADYDGDGDPDLFITCLGANHLFQNNGKGRFKDVTPAVLADGTERWRWHTGSAWLDYDRDGRPDLFVARYVRWTPETDQFCGIPGGLKRYCPPWKYTGERCSLYRNLGGGQFQDVSEATGVDRVTGKWFQPFVMDYDRDGWADVIVVSDGTATALFHNEEGRQFRDAAPEVGMGLSETGMPKAQMGIDAADWRNQGREAVLVGNFSGERLSLFEPDSSGLYTDIAGTSGLGESSLYSLTFGVAFLDADLDGWPDAFIGNGHIDDYIERFETGVTYRQLPLLYQNQQGRRFEEIGKDAGPAFAEKLVVRGCAVADYDRDGKPDLAVVQNNAPMRLLHNETTGSGHWLRVVLHGTKSGRDALGARVEVTANGVRQTRWLRAGGLFLSQNEQAILFGLGTATRVEVTVTWPTGVRTQRATVPADSVLEITEEG